MKYFVSSGDLENYEVEADTPELAVKKALEESNLQYLGMIFIISKTKELTKDTLIWHTVKLLQKLGKYNEDEIIGDKPE